MKKTSRPKRQPHLPLASCLALLTLAGLIAGLLGDGGFDALAWIDLGILFLYAREPLSGTQAADRHPSGPR